MALSKRFPTILLAVVASALTVTGVVLAATDPNPGGVAKDTLTLNGYPPHSASLLVMVSTGQAYSLSANVNVNFSTDSAQAIVHFPMVFSVASVDLRWVNDHLYAGSAEATSGPYLSVPLKQPALFGIALEMTKPDIALITGFPRETITRNGYITTYDFQRDNVAITTIFGGAGQQASIGSVDWQISVGSEGQVIGSTLHVKGPHAATTITATVLAYNNKVRISAPVSGQIQPVANSIIRRLLDSAPLRAVLIPQNLTSLGQLHLN